MLDGIIILNKPSGFTSHDCVAKIRRLSKQKRVGHTGTLDPLVTGVLPICLGQATRVAEYMLEQGKEYRATITLGRSTTTYDQAGDIVADKPLKQSPSEQVIRETLTSFVGQLQQLPPMYSAVKVKGKRLHQLARKGQEIERKPRDIYIYSIKLLHYHDKLPYPCIDILIDCSKGTYIRSLAVQFGEKLTLPAHLSQLVRTRSGPFQLSQGIALEQMENWSDEEWQAHLLPADTALHYLPQLQLEEDIITRIKFGQSIPLSITVMPDSLYRIYDQNNQFVAIYEAVHSHLIKPKKIFHKA
jgi:tRNA pseudouridine55 synthase